MRAVTDQLFPLTEWSSIDEFYADTTQLQTRHPDPRSLGQLVKDALSEATGLRCTIAVATGKTVAKIAADSHKPDGLVTVPPGTEEAFLALRPLRALPGIGPKTASRLAAARTQDNRRAVGPTLGSTLASYLRHATPLGSRAGAGIDHEPVVADRESKSLSHEITFEHDTHDRPFLERTLRGFLRDLARDLRQEGLAAGSCTVKLKNARFAITTKQHRFPHPLNYDPDMWPTVQQATTGTHSARHRVPLGRARALLLDARAARAVRPTADESHRDDGRADCQARVVGDWVRRREPRRHRVAFCLFSSERTVGMMQICP